MAVWLGGLALDLGWSIEDVKQEVVRLADLSPEERRQWSQGIVPVTGWPWIALALAILRYLANRRSADRDLRRGAAFRKAIYTAIKEDVADEAVPEKVRAEVRKLYGEIGDDAAGIYKAELAEVLAPTMDREDGPAP